MIGLPLAYQRTANPVEGAALLLPGFHALAMLLPEIGRQLLHAAFEEVRILDGLGDQRDAGLREFSLQRQRVGEDGVVGAVARQAGRER